MLPYIQTVTLYLPEHKIILIQDNPQTNTTIKRKCIYPNIPQVTVSMVPSD